MSKAQVSYQGQSSISMYFIVTEPGPSGPVPNPEVPIDEPQQPFSFGDFTKPSDYHGTVFWPQQWTDQTSSNQVSRLD